MTNESKLREAAQAVIDRWDTPLWKDVPATAVYINALREALSQDTTRPVKTFAGGVRNYCTAGPRILGPVSQPEQEPVAWVLNGAVDERPFTTIMSAESAQDFYASGGIVTEISPLYASPQPPVSQPEQEPVAWITTVRGPGGAENRRVSFRPPGEDLAINESITPLYAAPQPPQGDKT